MEAIKKRFEIDLDVKRSTTSRSTNKVKQGDNGNVFVINLTHDGEPIDLTGTKVLVVFSKTDGTAQQDTDGHGVTFDDEKNNRIVVEVYTTSIAPGLVECEVQILSGDDFGTLITSARFNFECERAIINDETVQATEEYPLLAGLVKTVEETVEIIGPIAETEAGRVATEEDRIAAETERVEAETAREQAELLREQEEADRIADEQIRIGNEATRNAAENQRYLAESGRTEAESERENAETARERAETTRKQNETVRTEAETIRANNEASRVKAESARVTAETDRAQNEFMRETAESNRVKAENLRANNENVRTGNEDQRIIAENARKSAETARAAAETARGKKWSKASATATTLAAGQSATANVTMSDNGLTFNFGIPVGEGTPGKTPVRGEDYWTAADKQEVINEVLATFPVYGGEVSEL